MTDIRIRATEPEDFAAIARIMNDPGVVAGTLQSPYPSADEWRHRLLERSPGSRSLVAEVDGKVVGMLGIMPEKNPRRKHAGSLGMMVADAFQGQGVGTALMAAAIDLADNWLNLERLELSVYVDNAPAVHLYEKFGFVIEGTARRFAFRNGEYVDAYSMARLRG